MPTPEATPNPTPEPSPPLPQTDTTTNTGGGAYIAGNAEAGADLVGRDKIVNIYQAPPPVEPAPRPPNPQRRLLFGGGVVTLLILGISLYGFVTRSPALCTDSRHCVLIAQFEPSSDSYAAEIVRKIRTQLADDTLLPTAQFNVQTIDPIADPDQVHQLATDTQAQVIVWGYLFQQFHEIKINFTLANQLGVGQSHQLRPERVQFFEPMAQSLTCAAACFAADNLRQVLDQLSVVVAQTAAGMLHYGLGEAESADQAFEVALYCSGEPVAPETVDLTTVTCNPDLELNGFRAGALYYYAGKAKILTGDYATALTYLEAAATQSPLDPAPHIGIATLYQSWLNRDKSPEIRIAFNEALRRTNALRIALVNRNAIPAELAAVDYELGFIAELQGDWGAAQRYYALAIEEFGVQSQAAYLTHIALGRVQRQAGNMTEADTTLRHAQDLDPTAPWATLELARLHQAERTAAEAFLATAREVAPHQAYVDITQAELCAAWQDFDCALSAYQRAEEKRPNSGWLAGRIGDFYRPTGDSRPHESWATAANYYAQAVEQRPHDPWAHERLAFALVYQGDYAAAAQQFAVSLHDLSPPQTQVAERYCTLAQVQQAAHLLDDALENAQTCLEKLQNPDLQARVEALIEQIQEAQNRAH